MGLDKVVAMPDILGLLAHRVGWVQGLAWPLLEPPPLLPGLELLLHVLPLLTIPYSQAAGGPQGPGSLQLPLLKYASSYTALEECSPQPAPPAPVRKETGQAFMETTVDRKPSTMSACRSAHSCC
jgi:hypothetical protein